MKDVRWMLLNVSLCFDDVLGSSSSYSSYTFVRLRIHSIQYADEVGRKCCCAIHNKQSSV
jgi:hypothetical protein